MSLTSFGARIRWVWIAIESIVSSGCPESAIYLWLPENSIIGKPLERLVSRGLNLQYVEDQKSHTKYCYLGQVSVPDDCLGYLLADDDMVYPMNWYKKMLIASLDHPNQPVVAYGCKTYKTASSLSFSCDAGVVSEETATFKALLIHPFSGSGLFIPKDVLTKLDKNPDHFLPICPTSDDIWLHREFFRIGQPVHNLGGRAMPPSIPFNSQKGALSQTNWLGGQNEVQIARAFSGLV